MSINKVIVTGNLTRDAELRSTPSGAQLLDVGIAVNERRRNRQTDQWEDYANFFDCTMWGERAQKIAQYLTKGTKVAIEGRLHYRSWEDKNTGQRRSKVDITIDNIDFMSSRNSGNGGAATSGGYAGGAQQQSSDNYPQAAAPSAYNDEDIPF